MPRLSSRLLSYLLPSLLLLLPGASCAVAAGTEVVLSFNHDIRPILSENCYACHGQDRGKRKGKLRLDHRDDALQPAKSGARAIVPGDVEKSELVQRILSDDEEEMMPPKKSHKVLSAKQKETLAAWVRQGALYEPHWAYIPVRRPAPPQLHALASREINPVDAFLFSVLEEKQTEPVAEADRRTLLRRLCFDLHGIPPTPEEADSFVADPDPKAYEAMVDRLLASPRFGERMAMQWLDLVRYADSDGYHGDVPFNAWPYRDYVLKSFASNMPFDRFTREQLAGDLLPDSTDEQKVASAYNRLLRVSAEGGIQQKEYLLKYMADRVRTTSTVWMGATLGCAECHDHKFDPYLAKDFYRFSAFFADLKQQGLYEWRDQDQWPPSIALPSPEQRNRMEELDAAIAKVVSPLAGVTDEALSADCAAWESQILALDKAGKLNWQVQKPLSAFSRNGSTLVIGEDHTVTSQGLNPDNETYYITFQPGAGTYTGLQVETQTDESFPGNRIARGGYSFFLSELEAAAAPDLWHAPLPLQSLFATAENSGTNYGYHFPAMAAIDGDPATGWDVNFMDAIEHRIAIAFKEPLVATAETVVTVTLRHDGEPRRACIGRLKLALSSVPDPEAEILGLPEKIISAIRTPQDKRSAENRSDILAYYRRCAPATRQARAELLERQRDKELYQRTIATCPISQPTDPMQIRLLPRGNWMDESGEVVQPGVPEFLAQIDSGTRRATRLDLANWLVSKENPLTARVFANRLWKQYFGTGLSKNLDDIGSQGELPSNPELLDWLASEFMEPGWDATGTHAWDIKHLTRTLLLSEAYRLSSVASPALEELDPANRLGGRQSRFRIDAELVRDNALSVSGLLVERLGGPSIRPLQPAGYWSSLNFPKRDWQAGHGESLYRRGLYIHWQRTFLYPSLLAFDAPSREECTVARTASNTPLQALILMNDPVFVEAARHLAEHAIREAPPAVDARLTWAWRRALSRDPEGSELQLLRELYTKNHTRFEEDATAARALTSEGESPAASDLLPADLAAMTEVSRAILNLHETITRN